MISTAQRHMIRIPAPAITASQRHAKNTSHLGVDDEPGTDGSPTVDAGAGGGPPRDAGVSGPGGRAAPARAAGLGGFRLPVRRSRTGDAVDRALVIGTARGDGRGLTPQNHRRPSGRRTPTEPSTQR